MMTKVISPAGWDFNVPVTALVKLGRDGRFLGHNDRSEFLKRASASFLDVFKNVKFADDEEPMHVIALGSTEAWGPNRNGDGFKEATCKQCCGTFVKHARWYRNHAHHNPARSFGIVKAAEYNPHMRRVELMVALNKTKEAAARNGGMVADKELRLIHSGDPVAVSMACKIAFDVCSACGNKARTRKEYCDGDSCPAGGAKNNLGKMVKIGNDVHHEHVDNPNPLFNDISDVSDTRPADRTAYASPADWLAKAAACGWVPGVGGAEAAEQLGLSFSVWDEVHPDASDMCKLAVCLARLDVADTLPLDFSKTAVAFTRAVQPGIEETFAKLSMLVRTYRLSDLLTAMAKQGAILPLRDFAVVAGCPSVAVAPALQQLPGIFASKIAGEIDGLSAKAWLNETSVALPKTASQLLDQSYGLTQSGLQHRLALAHYRGVQAPVMPSGGAVSDSPVATKLAVDYATYQVAAVKLSQNYPLTARLAIVQNRIL